MVRFDYPNLTPAISKSKHTQTQPLTFLGFISYKICAHLLPPLESSSISPVVTVTEKTTLITSPYLEFPLNRRNRKVRKMEELFGSGDSQG